MGDPQPAVEVAALDAEAHGEVVDLAQLVGVERHERHASTAATSSVATAMPRARSMS